MVKRSGVLSNVRYGLFTMPDPKPATRTRGADRKRQLVDSAAGRYALLPSATEPVRVLAGGREEIRQAAVQAALSGALAGVREQN